MAYRTTYPHAEFRLAAKTLLRQAEEQERGSYWVRMMCLVAVAFMVEASCNAIGEAIFKKDWNEEKGIWVDGQKQKKARERLSPKSKVRYLAGHLGLVGQQFEDTFTEIDQIFDARDSLAHGRPTTHLFSGGIENVESREWEKLATPELLAKELEHCEKLIEEFGRLAVAMYPDDEEVDHYEFPFLISEESAWAEKPH